MISGNECKIFFLFYYNKLPQKWWYLIEWPCWKMTYKGVLIQSLCPLFFIFLTIDSPLRIMIFFFSFYLKRFFLYQDIQAFVFQSFPLVSLFGHCFRGWSKINLKIYDVIYCVNNNFLPNFVWCLKKEKRYDIETLSIDI